MPSPRRSSEEEPGAGLVPAGLVEDCIEVHLARHAPTGRSLYLSTLALTLAAAAALPVVRVPVTVHANGILRPTVERQEARAAESGIVHSVRTRDGQRVRAGDTLMILDVRSIAARLATVDSIAHSRELELSDLARLLDAGDSLVTVVGLHTAHRRQQLREYAEVLSELVAREATERRATDRLRMLLARGFVASEQLDRQEAAHQTASAEIRQHRARSRSDWSGAHARLADEHRRLLAERAELTDALARLVVVSPVSGTVEMAASFSAGSVLQRGERVATISPNTPLIGEVLLTARDVALIGPGTPARLMIDALNYREWGTMDATVIEVADDATLRDAGPVFRARCRLSGSELRLRSGQRAALGKGMTFRASFVVAERSLLQRLFDRVDGWINPARADATMPVGT
ncbi:MAG TPA: HlyD family efflux transporter periplasmic adaptor subunit [Gemmatimonadaceae bacterium]|nr:HlyD family efflux transporter periplasmic adaptor subunit [Gemmatimonadaceae bacterium]